MTSIPKNIIRPQVKLHHATPEDVIAWTSRACYQSFEGSERVTDDRMLRHFARNDESPLEFAWAIMDIKCSYAAHVHLLRHRFFSFQWRSQRYNEKMEFVVPDGLGDEVHDTFVSSYGEAASEYLLMRRDNFAKKQDARYLIPQGVVVQGFMAGNARAWLNFLDLRTSKKAMPETREIANQIADQLRPAWGTILEARGL